MRSHGLGACGCANTYYTKSSCNKAPDDYTPNKYAIGGLAILYGPDVLLDNNPAYRP